MRVQLDEDQFDTLVDLMNAMVKMHATAGRQVTVSRFPPSREVLRADVEAYDKALSDARAALT